eukprot:scaffold78837_cov52-Phaeocystis_antarctica.AAC.1
MDILTLSTARRRASGGHTQLTTRALLAMGRLAMATLFLSYFYFIYLIIHYFIYYSLLATHESGGGARPASHSLLRSFLDGIARVRIVRRADRGAYYLVTNLLTNLLADVLNDLLTTEQPTSELMCRRRKPSSPNFARRTRRGCSSSSSTVPAYP